MCLSIPALVEQIEGDRARVAIGNNRIEVGTALVDHLAVGDYVLVHTGFAIQKIDRDEAVETIRIISELSDNEFNESL